MTLGTGSASSTLNFIHSNGTPYGSIVGNTSGLNLTSNSNLNIAGSGTSSTVQISNFKTLNITGADATSSVQISNITSLNAPGLGTLTASQVGTPLVLDSNNNIVKSNYAAIYLNRPSPTEVFSTTKGFEVNHINVTWRIHDGLFFYPGGGARAFDNHVNFFLINVNGNQLYPGDTFINWPTNTNLNSNSFLGSIFNAITPTLGNNSIPSTITNRFIRFPTKGVYSVTLYISFNTNYSPSWTISLIKNLTTLKGQNDIWENFSGQLVGKVVNSTGPCHTISGLIIIDNDGYSASPDTMSIIVTATTSPAGQFNALQSYQLLIVKI